jgi:transcriptional regulator with XRE-family HTH domain
MTGQLWSELGTTMRKVRGQAGISLRELESRGQWRRSTISQVENGIARPSRQLVEWYDTELGSDGLLMSIYAEARACQLRARPDGDDGDVLLTLDIDPPTGLLVNRGARLQARITLANGGTKPWHDRRLMRMGAYSGLRVISSAADAPVADLAPGEHTDVIVPIQAPELPGSTVAYWRLSDGQGRKCAPASPPVAVLLVVE